MRRFAFAALVVLAASCKPAVPAGAPEPAAPLSGPGLDGRPLSLAALKGKVVLVDFWATWCDPCRAEIPELSKLHSRLADRGFSVLGASMDEDKTSVPTFAKEMKMSYPTILLGGEQPPAGWIVPGLPTAYLIGRDGNIAQRYFGSKSADRLAADVEAVLGKK